MEIQVRIDRMKTKTTGLILALCFYGTASCFAGDPQLGSPKPNESKSKLSPETAKIRPTYISLVQFTDKGIQAAKQTTQRVAAWAAKVQSMGVTIKQMYWTLGQYDQVCIFEAPDDETAASALLAADMLGNIRTRTMRAFTASEMEKILGNVPRPGRGALDGKKRPLQTNARLRSQTVQRLTPRRLSSDVLPFDRIWYHAPNVIRNAIGYAKSRS